MVSHFTWNSPIRLYSVASRTKGAACHCSPVLALCMGTGDWTQDPMHSCYQLSRLPHARWQASEISSLSAMRSATCFTTCSSPWYLSPEATAKWPWTKTYEIISQTKAFLLYSFSPSLKYSWQGGKKQLRHRARGALLLLCCSGHPNTSDLRCAACFPTWDGRNSSGSLN